MDTRVIEFIRGLRAAGVRVSVAEAADAMRATAALGVARKDRFKDALRATLVKTSADQPAFETLFPLYFGSGGPPLQNAMESLDPDEQALVKAALSALTGRMQQLMDWLTSGDGPSKAELEALARRMGLERMSNPGQAKFITSRMLRDMGFDALDKLLRRLADQLAELGLSEAAIRQLLGIVEANRDALADQMAQQIGLTLAQQRAERTSDERFGGGELMDRPFQDLGPGEAELLRQEVRRLVAQLRSRAALRQRRAVAGKLDPRRTLRANQRFGGVPIDLRFRQRKLKPRLVLICDVSTSMRPVAEFMLRLIYELQDQVAHARSFAFNDDLLEISHLLSGDHVAEAVRDVLWAIPPGHYATDLGGSLDTLFKRSLDAVTPRTTVIILGDGRNNHRNPRTDLMHDLRRRAKRLIWLNPEPPAEWGTGDSDMLEYAPLCDAVYPVRNLSELAMAVDKLLAG